MTLVSTDYPLTASSQVCRRDQHRRETSHVHDGKYDEPGLDDETHAKSICDSSSDREYRLSEVDYEGYHRRQRLGIDWSLDIVNQPLAYATHLL